MWRTHTAIEGGRNFRRVRRGVAPEVAGVDRSRRDLNSAVQGGCPSNSRSRVAGRYGQSY
jgi:hypothetical protein